MTSAAPAPHPRYPLHLDARLDEPLSRWLWLVKWLLAVPHWILLWFLWAAFVVLSVVAFFAILFTGRYPRGIFDFNVGVLRWTWRVTYYSYGALGTDRYPPFTLAEVPDYPASLSVDYPEHLSRGLVLVKWWLLAIPHYVIAGFFVGGGSYLAWRSEHWAWQSGGGGLIGIVVLVAAVILLFTGRYPQPLYDFVLGMNRWVLRVAAYAGLMTDAYPPFRLDMGGADEGGVVAVLPYAGPPLAPPSAGLPAAAPPAGAAAPVAPSAVPAPAARSSRWTTGRVVAVVLGSIAALVGSGLLIGGGGGLLIDRTHRDAAGYLMAPTAHVSTTTYAVTSGATELRTGGPNWAYDLLGTVKLTASGAAGQQLFIGIGRTVDVDAYLTGVGHARMRTWQSRPSYDVLGGSAPRSAPADAVPWVAKTQGSGTLTTTWKASSGSWTAVVMNADGSAPVVADVRIGATLPVLGKVVAGLLIGGVVLVAAGAVAIVAGVRGTSS